MRNIVNKTKSSKNRFESLFKGIPIPTYSWQKIDEDLILIDYNDAAEKITNGTIKNYVGKNASEMYKGQPEILEELHRCANDRVSIFREMKYDYMSTGEEKFLSVMYGFIPPDIVIVHTEDITEKKKVLEKLKESEKELQALNLKLKHTISISEENYRTIFENTGTATAIVEEDTTISLVNGPFEELSGYSREEIEWKKSCTEFVIEEDLERVKKLHYSRISDPESTLKKYEFRFVNKEGNIRDIIITIAVIPNTKKSVASLLDITERKNTEIAMQELHENFTDLINNSPDGIIIADKNIRHLFANQRAAEITGYSIDELLSMHGWELTRTEEIKKYKDKMKKRLGGEPHKKMYERIIVRKDGREVLTEFRTSKTNWKGYIVPMVVFRDITERKKAEEKIKKEIEKSKNYLNIAGVIIVALDKDGIITLLNKKGHELLGYDEGELIGKNWFEVCLPPNDRERVYEYFKKLMAGEMELIKFYENSIWAKTGEERLISWSTVLFKDETGNMTGVLSSGEDITERKKAEEKLKVSEEKYRYLFDNAQVGLYWSRISDGKFLECNDIFAKLFGYDNREECLADYNAIEHFVDLNARSMMLEELRINKEVKNYEIHVTRRDGTPIWLSISARVFEKEDRIEGAAIDINEHKKAEQKLKENTKFIQNVFNAIQDGVSILDLDLNIVEVNPYMIEMYGQFDLIPRRKCYDVYQKRSSPCPWCPSIKTLETGQKNTSIVPYPTEKDPTGWIELTAFPLNNSDGILEGIIEYVKDITERKKAEQKLQLERDNFLNILNSMEDGVYIVDSNYDIEYLNPILIKEFGNIEGIKCFNYFHDFKEVCPWCKNEDVFQGKTIRWESYFTKNQKIYDIIGTPLKNPDRSISKLEIFRDITESKKGEIDLKESEEKYREAFNRAEFYKDLFAHDINNILQSILSGTQISQLILSNHEKFDDLKLNAEIIKDQVTRGSRLVSNVRKLSKIEEAGRSLEKIEILNVIKNTVSFVKKSYKHKNLAIRVDFNGEKLFIKANNLLEDVFENLLINAIRHNKNLLIEIIVRISRENKVGMSFLKLEFLDNGFGVADSMKEKIFQRGYSKDKGIYGMGLGLALVRGIIETYNGKIWVEDRFKGDRSKGSIFVLLIPEVD